MKLYLLTILLTFTSQIYSRKVEQCELAVALVSVARISRTLAPHLVCAAEKESGSDTAKVLESNNRKHYGIFQIKSNDCGFCDITCDKLIENNLNASVLCAKKIVDMKGLQYWSKWETFCKKQTVPNLSKCFDNNPVYPNSYGISIPVQNTLGVNRNIANSGSMRNTLGMNQNTAIRVNLRGRLRRNVGV